MEQDASGTGECFVAQERLDESLYREDLAAALPQVTRYPDLPGCDVSITGCESLVARTGTIVMSSAQASGRTTSVYAPVHSVSVRSTQLVLISVTPLLLIREKYANGGSFAGHILPADPAAPLISRRCSLPACTAPGEVYCFLLES